MLFHLSTFRKSRNGLTFCAMLIALGICTPSSPAQEKTAGPLDWTPALPGWVYRFPEDHASHPDYKTEWWYFTGNVRDDRGKAYGYELTFFRQGMLPPGRLADLFAPGQARSRFVQGDFKFAHFAVSELDGQRFHFDQRISRGAFDEAGFGPATSEDSGTPRRTARLVGGLAIAATDGRLLAHHGAVRLPHSDVGGSPAASRQTASRRMARRASARRRRASAMRRTTILSRDWKRPERWRSGKTRRQRVHGESWFDHEWASNQLAQRPDGLGLVLLPVRRPDGVDAVRDAPTRRQRRPGVSRYIRRCGRKCFAFEPGGFPTPIHPDVAEPADGGRPTRSPGR